MQQKYPAGEARGTQFQQHEQVLYTQGWGGSAGRQYEKDFNRRTAEGWRLVLLQQTISKWGSGGTITAVWQR